MRRRRRRRDREKVPWNHSSRVQFHLPCHPPAAHDTHRGSISIPFRWLEERERERERKKEQRKERERERLSLRNDGSFKISSLDEFALVRWVRTSYKSRNYNWEKMPLFK
jgi:hypothetical protein